MLESGKGQSTPALVCVETAQTPVECIFPARALSRVERDERAVSAQVNSNTTGNLGSSICVVLTNFSDEELTVTKATILGIVEEISESLVDKILSRSVVNSTERASRLERERMKPYIISF
jgi:hypothetical protein